MTDTPDTLTDDAGQAPPSETPPSSDNGTEPPTQDLDDGGGDSALRKVRRESVGLRKRLRDTEAERDQLRDQLDAHRHDAINQIAADAGLPDPELLAAAGYEPDAFITEDGRVDRDKVTDACRDAMQRFNVARKGRAPKPNPQQGRHGQPQRQPDADWKAAFAPPRR